MFRLFLRTASICLLIALTGCGPLPVKMDLPNYSMGPVKSSDFPALVQQAMTVSDQVALVFDIAGWSGFWGSHRFSATEPYFSGVAALTETEIVLLLWNEIEEAYEIVSRVPYANLSLNTQGLFGVWQLYFKDQELSFGRETFTAKRATYLSFNNKAKEKEALLLLEAKVDRNDRPINTSFDDDY